jgi:hypothetical protein
VDQPPACSHRREGLAGDLAADRIEHQIGTFSIRQLLHLLGQRPFRRGNDVIRAELLNFRGSFRFRHNRDNAGS